MLWKVRVNFRIIAEVPGCQCDRKQLVDWCGPIVEVTCPVKPVQLRTHKTKMTNVCCAQASLSVGPSVLVRIPTLCLSLT